MFRIHQRREARLPYESNACSLIAVACFAFSAMYHVPDYVLMPLGFALLIHSLADGGAALSRYLTVSILEWIGILSYSTYLIHYFVKDWVKFLLVTPAVPSQFPLLVALGATAIASIGLYYFVEVPGRRAIRSLAR
jgi:peptidoglycan/LPS O-acetylase OafA/YrhL